MQKGGPGEFEMSHWQEGVSLNPSEQCLVAVDAGEGCVTLHQRYMDTVLSGLCS